MRSVLILLLLTLSAPAREEAKAPDPLPPPETLLLEPPPGTLPPPGTGTGITPPPASDNPAAPASAPAPAVPTPPAPKTSAPTTRRTTQNSEALPPGPVPLVNMGAQDKTGRTFSDDSPFIIWGGTREQRSNLFSTAGLVRRDTLDALHLGLDWRNNIIIQLREPLTKGSDRRPPVWTSIGQVPGGFRIEINLVPRLGSVPGPLLRENIVRATLADLILRGHEKDDLTGRDMPPPDWLLHGALALMDYRQLGRMSSTFSTVFQLGRVLPISDILGADPESMDSVSLTIYRVSCCGLLMMLIDQPNGPANLEKLLPQLALTEGDPSPLIERTFPALSSSANSLSKWWTLQIAALSQPGLDEVRSPAETEQLLGEALILRYTIKPEEKKPGTLKRLFSKNKTTPAEANGKDGKDLAKTGAAATLPAPQPPPAPAPQEQSCDIQDFAKVIDLPDHESILNKPNLDLTLLLLRAHPVYRPIITEYQAAIRNLAKGKKLKEASATLERLATTRRKLAGVLQDIENQLNDYETRKSMEKSGTFEDYLRTAAEFERPPAPRPDPVSRYLDAVEAEISE